MVSYLSLPLFQTLMDAAEEPHGHGHDVESARGHDIENSVMALANTTLNLFFPLEDDWNVAPRMKIQSRLDGHLYFVIRQVQRVARDNRNPRRAHAMYSHVVVNATRAANDLATGLEQLERDLEVETNNLMPSRLWAILFHGLELRFYEYHRDLPAGHRLIPMSPPSEPGQHTLKMRDDEEEIQGMMTYLVLNEPTAI